VYIAGKHKRQPRRHSARHRRRVRRQYGAGGTLRWTQLLGTRTLDIARGITVDPSGAAYIAGQTAGHLGVSNAGGIDAYLAKYK
jgi:hypothetical protein